MIGNAAAAIQGCPLYTADIDFLIMKEESVKIYRWINENKFQSKILPKKIRIWKQTYNQKVLPIDFHISNSTLPYASLMNNSTMVSWNNYSLNIASLENIAKSKRARNTLEDQWALCIFDNVLKFKKGTLTLKGLEHQEQTLIENYSELKMENRINFLALDSVATNVRWA